MRRLAVVRAMFYMLRRRIRVPLGLKPLILFRIDDGLAQRLLAVCAKGADAANVRCSRAASGRRQWT